MTIRWLVRTAVMLAGGHEARAGRAALPAPVSQQLGLQRQRHELRRWPPRTVHFRGHTSRGPAPADQPDARRHAATFMSAEPRLLVNSPGVSTDKQACPDDNAKQACWQPTGPQEPACGRVCARRPKWDTQAPETGARSGDYCRYEQRGRCMLRQVLL
jgi:hypothetical protein